MHLGALRRLAPTVVGLTLTVIVVGGCAEAQSMVPLAPVVSGSSRVHAQALAQAETQADRLVLMLEALEEHYVPKETIQGDVPPSPPAEVPVFLSATPSVSEIPEQLSTHFNLAVQPRAFVQAQAAYLEDAAPLAPRPVSVTVTGTDVEVIGSTPEGVPVARVTIQTTYDYADGPSTVNADDYALTWESGSNVDSHGAQARGPHFDGLRLTSILPLYGQADSPALDSGLGKKSPSNAVHSYVRAITHGSSENISDLEGPVRSSDDFRDLLKERLLAGPRYTVVELPAAQLGSAHVLYVVQDEVPGALRLDVTLGRDGATVVPTL